MIQFEFELSLQCSTLFVSRNNVVESPVDGVPLSRSLNAEILSACKVMEYHLNLKNLLPAISELANTVIKLWNMFFCSYLHLVNGFSIFHYLMQQTRHKIIT